MTSSNKVAINFANSTTQTIYSNVCSAILKVAEKLQMLPTTRPFFPSYRDNWFDVDCKNSKN